MERFDFLDRLVAVAADCFGLDPETLRSRGRRPRRPAVDARYLVMLIAVEKGEYPVTIAEYFGVHRSMVYYGLRHARNMIANYEACKRRYEYITSAL